MRLPRCILLASILISALLTAGCGGVVSNLKEIGIVQSELTKKFGEEVTVNAANSPKGVMLSVWFINSKLNDETPGARQIRAEQTVEILKTSYPRMQSVAELWVGYIRKKTRLVVFHHTQVVALLGFDKDGRPMRNMEPTQPRTEIEVTAAYDRGGDVTDVSVSGILLEGQPGGYGLTVLPFFKVPGDARAKEGNGAPPKTVTMNIASYSEKPKFEQTTLVSFVADGKVVHKEEGTFTGQDAQFCYVDVPYSAFRRMVGGKELIMKLGDKEYPLTPSQLGAMRSMTEYVRK